jgi:RNA polymerase sigma factor (TIGR02999 family)
MRRILIDHARRRKAQKRGDGARRLPIDDALDAFEERAPDLVALGVALERLERMDAELARIVELRFFAGATNEEIARALDVSTRTVERGWKTAQAFLRAEIAEAT